MSTEKLREGLRCGQLLLVACSALSWWPGEVRSQQDLEGCGVELKAKPEAPGR